MSPKSSLLLLLFAWALASGLQVPRLVAMARFTPDAAPVFYAEGPAWSDGGGKKACSMTLHPREGGSLVFGCEGLAWPESPALSAGGYAKFTWIVVPCGAFGGDLPEPLTIVQGKRIISSTDASWRTAILWHDMLMMLGLTQLVAIVWALWLVVANRRERAREFARAKRALREARERRNTA